MWNAALAGILRKNILAASIDVDGKMDAQAETIFSGANAGAAAVGASVSYARLGAKNSAILDATGVTVDVGSVSVTAGEEGSSNSAKVQAVSFSNNVGTYTGTMNVAIADNCSSNIASIFGNASTQLTANSVLVLAVGEATAKATVAGMDIGGSTIAASVAVAVLRSTQEAPIQGGTITVNSLTAHSLTAIASGAADPLTVTGGTEQVLSHGQANTLASITNQSFAAISAGLMTGYAYAQGVFEAYLRLDEGDSLTADSVSVETTYTANATTHLTPSVGGVEGALASIKANVAVSNASSDSSAKVYGGGPIPTAGVICNSTGT